MSAKQAGFLVCSPLCVLLASACSGASTTTNPYYWTNGDAGASGSPEGGMSSASAGGTASAGSGVSGAGAGTSGNGGVSSSGANSGSQGSSGSGNSSSGSSGGASTGSSSGGSNSGGSSGSSSGGSDAGAGSCPAPPSTEPANSVKAANDTNAVRSLMGSPCATLVPALDVSAQKHCDYYAANGSNSSCTSNAHVEVSGCTGYVAANFNTRETMAGYTGQPSYEVMAFSGNPDSSTQQWIDSVWHRIPMLSPWVRDMGYGGTTTPAACDTIDFGVGASTPSNVTAFYPYNGQTGVPTSFNGSYEGPAPPAPSSGWPSGYPIILYVRSATVQSHQITVDGTTTALSHVWIDGTNATNGKNDYILYTDSPLSKSTTYHVQIAATQGSTSLNFDWKFTTGTM